MFILHLLLFICSYSAVYSKSIVKIGGLFNPFDDKGQPIDSEIQAIAAFKLAIEQINNDTSFLPDYELKGIVHNGYDVPTSVASILDFINVSYYHW
jgi:hypothetical protein